MNLPRRLAAVVALLSAQWSGGGEAAESLTALYTTALANNPVYLSRLLEVEQAEAQVTVARAPLLPQLSVTATFSENEFTDDLAGTRRYDGTRSVVQARQALFDLTSYFRLKSARATRLQLEQESEAARLDLAGQLLERYLDVLLANDELVYIAAEKAATQSQLEQVTFMVERQLRKQTDLYELSAYFESLLTREIEARNTQALALEALRETTGLAVSEVEPLGERTPPLPAGDVDLWLQAARDNNRTLLALQHAIDAAGRVLTSERARHLPQLSLNAVYTDSDQGFDNRQLPPYQGTTVSLQLSVPLFEGGRVRGSVREARAEVNIARQRYEQSLREIERQTRGAYLDMTASQARIASTAREVDALEKVVQSQQRGYELGVGTVVDLLIAQRRLFRARSDYAEARYALLRDIARLKIQTGSWTDDDIETLAGFMRKGN